MVLSTSELCLFQEPLAPALEGKQVGVLVGYL